MVVKFFYDQVISKGIYTVKPLLKQHNIFCLSIKEKFIGPYKTYNSKITPNSAGPTVPIIERLRG